jgi:hypothetical protein
MCGARRRNGLPCRKAGMMPSGRCRLHGGMTPHGISSPHFRTGRHCRHLPKHLKADQEQAASDAQLVSLRSELALIEVRFNDLFKAMSKVHGPRWKTVIGALDEFRVTLRAGDKKAKKLAFAKLCKLIRSGSDGQATYDGLWVEVLELIQDKRKVAKVEWKRLAALKNLLPLPDVLTVLVAFLNRIKERVHDPETLRALQNDLTQLIGARCSPEKRAQINKLSALR